MGSILVVDDDSTCRDSIKKSLEREGYEVQGARDVDGALEALKEREVVIRIRLGNGAGTATAFGCDLGYEYVRVNSEYTT